ncbi:hypothetical protein E4U42_006713 [Claviceps africana]|uniref:Uncharacterized protein n=1 Tax=Claviceps africana TaxID=83212 RepID=A0A8K0J2N7_9HYPO|nr:hypothetical protein E4U42_006713 [Claviceps africana]
MDQTHQTPALQHHKSTCPPGSRRHIPPARAFDIVRLVLPSLFEELVDKPHSLRLHRLRPTQTLHDLIFSSIAGHPMLGSIVSSIVSSIASSIASSIVSSIVSSMLSSIVGSTISKSSPTPNPNPNPNPTPTPTPTSISQLAGWWPICFFSSSLAADVFAENTHVLYRHLTPPQTESANYPAIFSPPSLSLVALVTRGTLWTLWTL